MGAPFTKAEAAVRRAFGHRALPLRVHLCDEGGVPEREACGIVDAMGRFIVQDESHDECHHPMNRAEAEATVALLNELLSCGESG